MQKWLCIGAMAVAGILLLVYLADLALWGSSLAPFGTAKVAQDVLIIVAAGLILWQGWETLKEVG